MLRAIEIENFKAFGERTRIELAPITLIYGQNSAGKSSILQALNLLKQTHESRDSGAALLPRAEGGIVDLGSFRELLFDHDVRRVLRLGVEVSLQDSPSYIWRRFMGNAERSTPLGLDLAFSVNAKSQEVALDNFAVGIGTLRERFAEFKTRNLHPSEYRELYRMGWSVTRRSLPKRRDRVSGAECTWVTESPATWKPVHRAWASNRQHVFDWLGVVEQEGHRRRTRPAETLGDLQPTQEEVDRSLAIAREFYSKDFTLSAFIDRMTAGLRGAVVGLDGFLPVTPRPSIVTALPELELLDSRLTPPKGRVSLPSKDVAGIAFLAGRLLEEQLDALFPMGPFRRPPERWYIFTGTSPTDVGYKGDHLPDLLFRQPELVEQANGWLERLDIGYRINVQSIGDGHSDLFEVRLFDTRRREQVDVGLSDVGFGISQLLPFVVQSLASTDQVISIEQPEVHIHPRLQADLGELLAASIYAPYSHQFLIETHSEHLLLRLQRLIRERKLKPSDVAIIYVERGPNGSRVQRLRLDDQGEFIDEWPGGFFPERLREMI